MKSEELREQMDELSKMIQKGSSRIDWTPLIFAAIFGVWRTNYEILKILEEKAR